MNPMLSQISEMETMFERLGFPLAVIVLGVLAAWRVAKWIGPLMKGWIERLVVSHEELTKSCITIGESNAKTLSKQETVLAAQALSVNRIERLLEGFEKTQKMMHKQNLQSHESHAAHEQQEMKHRSHPQSE